MGLGQAWQKIGHHIGGADTKIMQHIGCLINFNHHIPVSDLLGLRIGIPGKKKAHGKGIRVYIRPFFDQFIRAFLRDAFR